MSDERWMPKSLRVYRRRAFRGDRAARRDGVARYAALEFPHESVSWLLKPRPDPEPSEIRLLAPGRGNRVRGGIVPPRGL